jgi:hypothetical protein
MEKSHVLVAALLFPAAGIIVANRVTTPPEPELKFHKIDLNSPEEKYRASFASDNDKTRDALRLAVLRTANDLAKDPCDSGISSRYIQAAVNYARAYQDVVPCEKTNSCWSLEVKKINELDRQQNKARQQFGTPLDLRAQEAMQRAHETSRLKSTDFPPELTNLLAHWALDPEIHNPSNTSFRIRPPNCAASP